MAASTSGTHIKWRTLAECPRHGYVDLAPGVVSDDGTAEIRTCHDCGSEIATTPYFTCPPSDADTTDLG